MMSISPEADFKLGTLSPCCEKGVEGVDDVGECNADEQLEMLPVRDAKDATAAASS